MSGTKILAVVYILLGVAAILLPYLFGTFAVMILGAVVLASGIVTLFYLDDLREKGFPVSVLSPWVYIIIGGVILIWPELALWFVAVIIGGGFILNGVNGLQALRDSGVVNPPMLKKIWLWESIVLGVLLVFMGAFGSAVLLGLVLGIGTIYSGYEQWRLS